MSDGKGRRLTDAPAGVHCVREPMHAGFDLQRVRCALRGWSETYLAKANLSASCILNYPRGVLGAPRPDGMVTVEQELGDGKVIRNGREV